jgi:hypothetical protein
VLAVDDLPKDFLGRWWHIAEEVEGGFPAVVATGAIAVGFGIVAEMGVVGIGVVEFGNVVEMGVVGWGGGVIAEVEALASAPVGG